MGDILIIKMNDGKFMTHCRLDSTYGDKAALAASLVAEHHPAKAVDAYAVCECEKYERHYVAHEDICNGIDIMAKSAVTTETIITPDGVALQDIDDADAVVCTSNPET